MFGIKTKIKRVLAHLVYLQEFAPTGGKSLVQLDCNKKYRISLPTYDGSGQSVHPDIFFDESVQRFVMAYTPYPHTNDKFENPCIALSDDGIHFYEERAGINPLVPAPQKDHNDDPDISLRDGIYTLLYLETLRPERQNLVALQSRDRLSWAKRILHTEPFDGGGERFMLSPSVLYHGAKCYCYYVNRNYAEGHRLCVVSGGSVDSLDFSHPAPVQVNGLPPEVWPWHVDVIHCADADESMLMFFSSVKKTSGKSGEYNLYVAKSNDLYTWNVNPRPLIKNCYRSSGFVRDDFLYVYFSSNYYADEWTTALLKIPLDSI